MKIFMRIMIKMLIIMAFICIISMLPPNYHAMAQHDGNSQEGLRPQQKGKTQEEMKQSEDWKTRQDQKKLNEWKTWYERKKLEEWKARQEQKKLQEWKMRQAQKKMQEWKAQQEKKILEERKQRNGWKGERYPYGGYYHSPREGKYGQRRTIRTEAEARKVLLNYFAPQKATIGAIREKGWFFEPR